MIQRFGNPAPTVTNTTPTIAPPIPTNVLVRIALRHPDAKVRDQVRTYLRAHAGESR